MDFLAKQRILKSSKKYKPVYKFFSDTYGIKYPELFVLVAAIGFVKDRNNIDVEKNGGAELRSNYFDNSQKASLYSIILNDPSLGKNIESFEEDDSILEYCKLLESYADGGMDILVEEVFRNKWNGISLDEDYVDYDLDVISYYLAHKQNVPF